MSEPTYFKYDLSHLSKSERDTIKILEKVGKVVHKIWLKQIDNEKVTGNFYPSDISKEELIEAAKKNQNLLSPYTIVKRDKDRKLFAVHYKDEYRKEHEAISTLLQQAIGVTEDKKLKTYLSKLEWCLMRGNFDKALEVFLKNSPTKIEIIMGPIESYTDHFMDIKRSYQYSLRILRDDETSHIKKMSDVIRNLGVLRPNGSIAAKLRPIAINFRIDDVYMFAGRQAGSMPSGTNLPNQPDLVNKLGLKILIYHNVLVQKFGKVVKPLLKYIKGKDYVFKSNDILFAKYRLSVVHEISEGIVKYLGMEKRLGEYFDVMRELNADIFALRSSKYHFLQGLITQEEYNNLLVAYIANCVSLLNRSENESSLKVYAKGMCIAFNYFFKSKALSLKAGNITIDFEKLVDDVDEISDIILSIMARGTSKDVALLQRKWGDRAFMSKLPKLK